MHQGALGALVQPILAVPGVHEQVQADLGEQGFLSAGSGPDHMAHDAAGEIIPLDAVLLDGLYGAVQAAEKADDDAVHAAFADIALHLAAFLPLGKAEGAVHRQVLGMAGGPEAAGDGLIQIHGRSTGRKGVHPDGIPIPDEIHGFLHGIDLVH